MHFKFKFQNDSSEISGLLYGGCWDMKQFVAPCWLLGIIINTLANLPLTLPLSLSLVLSVYLSLSYALPRALFYVQFDSLQPLKLHALALAIIKLRHQSDVANGQHNCNLQLPGQLPAGKWSKPNTWNSFRPAKEYLADHPHYVDLRLVGAGNAAQVPSCPVIMQFTWFLLFSHSLTKRSMIF